MSIHVTCPNGHRLKIKDKYAGKRGLCPFCEDKVFVDVPHKLSEEEIADMIGTPAPTRLHRAPSVEEPVKEHEEDSASIFDDTSAEASSMSLVGASAIRHRQQCPQCGDNVPYWFAKCPRCDTRLEGHT